jgi:signal transduction histidine kinase/CheY-like chemotaxis protein
MGLQNFLPHGFCMRWDPSLIATFIAANIGIALAYFAIPCALWYVTRKRADLPNPWMFRLFAMFIVACGATHLMKVWTLYQPVYWLETGVDLWTACISLLTAVLLWPLIPKCLSLRSPRELEALNVMLKANNEELLVARDRALEASNLKSAFIANVSHELRTPLTGILGMQELLLGTRLDEEQKDMLETAHSSAQSLLALINDILDLSKIEAGKMHIESVELNVVAIAHDCVQVVRSAAEQKDLLLTTDIDSRIQPALYGDPVRLHQVLLNLLGNAVKFTHRGSVTARALIDREDENYVTVRFLVTDTGIGISDGEQRFLFSPFTQVDGSTRRRYGGSGLGLAISKRLVELMGGEIGVTSSRGQGSTFWFSVALRRRAELDATIESSPQAEAGLPAGILVLVVEDNPALLRLALKQLWALGLEACGVPDGEAALSELGRRNYALVLMDCHLPKLDGYDVTRLIRRQEAASREHLPIIAMTAGAMKGDPEKCLESGMDDYLSKPYTLDQLRQKLQSWLPAGSLRES